MDFLKALHWRYATKRMSGQRIPEPQLDRILEATHLAPSSYGLQPYVVKVISDQSLLARIREEAAPQPQVTECSHLLVFATMTNLNDPLVDQFIQLTAEQRGLSVGNLKDYADSIKGTINGFESDEVKQAWAARQAYIALGFALSAAAIEGVDASPMEGFEPAALDSVLGLAEQGLNSVVIAALGYRDTEKDKYAALPKVRRPRPQLIQAV